MTLNDYRDEAKEFMTAIGAGGEHVSKILGWLDEELAALKEAAAKGDLPKLRHQVYDVLFLLFELAARFDVDLDGEWADGRQRKQEKYSKRKGNTGDD